MSAEQWRPVVGHERFYDVSDQGRVRSWRPWRGQPLPRLMSQKLNSTGYPVVHLRVENRPVMFAVHRLVMEAFVGPLPEGMLTRHLNGNPLDARLANLAYGTPRENNLDTLTHGAHRSVGQTHCKRGHELSGVNLRYSRSGKRVCRACDRLRKDRHRAKSAEAVAS